jgi:aminoglycoside phosphotransferase (APT) family kinase protein
MPPGKMHADQVHTDARLVGRLVATQFPQWADLPIEPVPSGGTDNALYRLGEDMVVRLPLTPRAVGRLEKERRWLPTLAPLLPLAVPTPLAKGLPGEDYPWEWSVYDWLPGDIAAVEPIADHARAASDLAEFVLALRRVDSADGPPPGEHNSFRGASLTIRDPAVRAAIAALGDTIDGTAVTAAWESALRAPEWQQPPVWFHGDLDARNVLVRQGRVSAVIDFGCLGIGDPACEAAAAWALLSAGSRDIFRDALSVDDATWERGRGWALSSIIALDYYRDTNAIIVEGARRTVAEVLADYAAS